MTDTATRSIDNEENRSGGNQPRAIVLEDDELQSLLQVARENDGLRTSIRTLELQIAQLEQGLAPMQTEEQEKAPPSGTCGVTATESRTRSRSSNVSSMNDDSCLEYEEDMESDDDGAPPRRSGHFRRSNARSSGASRALSRASSAGRASRSRHHQEPPGSILDADLLEQHLSEDAFGFLLAAPTWSAPFALGVGVLLFQVTIYILMASNLIQPEQFGRNLFGIPANVSEPVWIAQIIAIIIAVVTQDDIRTGLDMLREGYGTEMQAAFPHSTGCKFVLSTVSRLVGGSLGLIVNFLLIVTSATVIDLLLNFTALAFVSQLDEASFFLSKQGFAGKACLEHATLITEAYYYVPKAMVQGYKTILMIFIFVAMLAGWSVVRYNQIEGKYLCATILVQMGDDMRPELGTFSGLYDLQAPSSGVKSRHVQFVDRHAGKTRFAFCDSQSYWTLQWPEEHHEGSHAQDFQSDPCNNWHVRSSETTTFDLVRAADIPWYVRDEYGREMKLEPFFLHCFECGNSLNAAVGDECSGRGTCSDAVCTCDNGWYGLRCEFLEPCQVLSVDARATGFERKDLNRESSERYRILTSPTIHEHSVKGEATVQSTTAPPQIVEAYHRPVYMGHYVQGHYDLLFFTGRRWAQTHTGLLHEINLTDTMTEQEAEDRIAKFFLEDFHAHWSFFEVEWMSEAMDLSTPDDASAPIELQWFEADAKPHADHMAIQSPNTARPVTALYLCAVCTAHSDVNPCYYDGVCMEGACQCALGVYGALCEKSPVRNGHCDAYYNVPDHFGDGGDCCDSTVS
jgi:hypothetical protein